MILLKSYYPTKEEVIEINKSVGSNGVVVNEGALENTIETLHITHGVFKQAAVLCCNLTSLHVFVDGNKRTALAATITFLKLSGLKVRHYKNLENEAVSILYQIAQNKISKSEVEKWLKRLVE